jgi:hypothetical protein
VRPSLVFESQHGGNRRSSRRSSSLRAAGADVALHLNRRLRSQGVHDLNAVNYCSMYFFGVSSLAPVSPGSFAVFLTRKIELPFIRRKISANDGMSQINQIVHLKSQSRAVLSSLPVTTQRLSALIARVVIGPSALAANRPPMTLSASLNDCSAAATHTP